MDLAVATLGNLLDAGFRTARLTCGTCRHSDTLDLAPMGAGAEGRLRRWADLAVRLKCTGCGAYRPAAELDGPVSPAAVPKGQIAWHGPMPAGAARPRRRVAIVGCAGRGEDARHLTPGIWNAMLQRATGWIGVLGAGQKIELVSGGSAFADHLAVALFLAGRAEALDLHLPCAFDAAGRRFVGPHAAAAARLGELHRAFAAACGVASIEQIAEAVGQGARLRTHTGGFAARNEAVANDGEVLLAFTFGKRSADVKPGRRGWADPAEAGLKPGGGTAQTWSLAAGPAMRRKIHVDLRLLAGPAGAA